MAHQQIEFFTKQSDILIALLHEIPFNGIQETDFGFVGFVNELAFKEKHLVMIDELKSSFTFLYKTELIQDINWNEKWESDFESVQVRDFCNIRADFHEPSNTAEHDIIINPKMAFGTGHHATTAGIISMMEEVDFVDKKVLDYGCGTGVLAILAEKMGAIRIDAIDIELEAYENSLENSDTNNCKHINVIHGDISKISGYYDIIIANINRNVILDSIPALNSLLQAGGILFTSGFLDVDYQLIKDKLSQNHLLELECEENNSWLCILAKKLK